MRLWSDINPSITTKLTTMSEETTFTVAILKATSLGEDTIVAGMTYEELLPKLESLAEFVTTTQNGLMETIANGIQLTPKLLARAVTCWEDGDSVYQLFFVSKEDQEHFQKSKSGDGEEVKLTDEEEKSADRPLNQIGTLLMGKEQGVYGDVVLLKSEIQDDHFCRNGSVSLERLTELLHHRYYHQGVMIPSRGEMTQFEYQSFPLESLPQNDQQGYSCTEVEIFGLKLFLYFLIGDHPSLKVNRRATRILGERKIMGPVYIINRISEHNYGDLDLEMAEQLSNAAYGPMKKRELEGEELEHGKRVDGLAKMVNPYRVLRIRGTNHQKHCDCCHSTEEKLTHCSGCYRLRYHSRECQKDDWKTHKDDCIKSIKTMNMVMEEKIIQQQIDQQMKDDEKEQS